MRIFTAFFFFLQSVILSFNSAITDEPVATIGSHKIYFSEFSERYTDYLLATGVKDNIAVREAILNNMVNEILLRYYDDNSNILNDSEFQKENNWMEKQVLLAFLKDQEVHSKIIITDEELRETFVRVNESIAASHLYTTSEEEAIQIYEMLKIGVDWDNLAYQLFSDSLLRATGGYLGYFTWGDMDPAFEDAVYSLKPGEYSQPVKTAYGYSIIRVEDRKPHPLLTEWEYNLRKPKLTNVLRIRKKIPAEREFVKALLETSELKFNESALAELYSYIISPQNVNEIEKKFVDQKIASFYGRDITSAEAMDMINRMPAYKKEVPGSAESLKSIITGLLLQDKLYNTALEAGYDTISYVKSKIDNQQMQVFFNYKQREVISEAQISEEEIRRFYTENIQYFTASDEINIQEIIVSDLSLADSLKYMIQQGEDFGTLAGKFSERTWSAENNGEAGYIPVSRLGYLKETFTDAEVGEILGPVRLEDKYGLFRVLGKKAGKVMDFEDSKSTAENGVKYEKRGISLSDHIQNIQASAEIKINRDYLLKQPIAGLN